MWGVMLLFLLACTSKPSDDTAGGWSYPLDDVLRVIYSNREWLRKYAIKLALVKNPKVPQGVSMRLMTTLHEHDVKGLSKDKNVPGSVQMLAKKQLEKKVPKKAE